MVSEKWGSLFNSSLFKDLDWNKFNWYQKFGYGWIGLWCILSFGFSIPGLFITLYIVHHIQDKRGSKFITEDFHRRVWKLGLIHFIIMMIYLSLEVGSDPISPTLF